MDMETWQENDHVSNMLYKTKICTYFKEGRCKRQFCSYAHGNRELRRAPDFTKTVMCHFLVDRGVCFASDCKFAHSQDELRRSMQRLQGDEMTALTAVPDGVPISGQGQNAALQSPPSGIPNGAVDQGAPWGPWQGPRAQPRMPAPGHLISEQRVPVGAPWGPWQGPRAQPWMPAPGHLISEQRVPVGAPVGRPATGVNYQARHPFPHGWQPLGGGAAATSERMVGGSGPWPGLQQPGENPSGRLVGANGSYPGVENSVGMSTYGTASGPPAWEQLRSGSSEHSVGVHGVHAGGGNYVGVSSSGAFPGSPDWGHLRNGSSEHSVGIDGVYQGGGKYVSVNSSSGVPGPTGWATTDSSYPERLLGVAGVYPGGSNSPPDNSYFGRSGSASDYGARGGGSNSGIFAAPPGRTPPDSSYSGRSGSASDDGAHGSLNMNSPVVGSARGHPNLGAFVEIDFLNMTGEQLIDVFRALPEHLIAGARPTSYFD